MYIKHCAKIVTVLLRYGVYLLFPLRPSWLSIEFLENFFLLSPKDSGPPDMSTHQGVDNESSVTTTTVILLVVRQAVHRVR